jgi:ATP-binding cassette, subfamily B, bacterial
LRVLMEGRTTLVVAHRLSTIGLADRVVLLDDGRIVADGAHAELLASTPLYVEVLAAEAEAGALQRPGTSVSLGSSPSGEHPGSRRTPEDSP